MGIIADLLLRQHIKWPKSRYSCAFSNESQCVELIAIRSMFSLLFKIKSE